MFSFKGFFTQEKNTLNTLEDDIINNGSKGGENAINFLKSVEICWRNTVVQLI